MVSVRPCVCPSVPPSLCPALPGPAPGSGAPTDGGTPRGCPRGGCGWAGGPAPSEPPGGRGGRRCAHPRGTAALFAVPSRRCPWCRRAAARPGPGQSGWRRCGKHRPRAGPTPVPRVGGDAWPRGLRRHRLAPARVCGAVSGERNATSWCGGTRGRGRGRRGADSGAAIRSPRPCPQPGRGVPGRTALVWPGEGSPPWGDCGCWCPPAWGAGDRGDGRTDGRWRMDGRRGQAGGQRGGGWIDGHKERRTDGRPDARRRSGDGVDE